MSSRFLVKYNRLRSPRPFGSFTQRGAMSFSSVEFSPVGIVVSPQPCTPCKVEKMQFDECHLGLLIQNEKTKSAWLRGRWTTIWKINWTRSCDNRNLDELDPKASGYGRAWRHFAPALIEPHITYGHQSSLCQLDSHATKPKSSCANA